MNKINNISTRSVGVIDNDGVVRDINIISFDIVGLPGFSNAKFDIDREIQRQKLREERIKKLNKLNQINNNETDIR